MRIKKILRRALYALLLLLGAWFIAVQAGCFAMRTTDRQWANSLRAAGQKLAPRFMDVRAGGRSIHAVVISQHDSLPLTIMVHGSPGSSDAFLPYLEDTMLSKSTQMASIDRPGFGYSSGFGNPEPSLQVQAAAVKAVADQLAPGKKVLLVGHSMGGPIIARFAMDYPDQVAGLVIVAGSIDPALEEHPWWQKAVSHPPLSWMTPQAFRASNAEIAPLEDELRQMLPLWERITCPVTIIHAKDDLLVPFANVDFARKVLRNCRVLNRELLPEGDHFILWSRTDVVKKAMLEVLNIGATE